MIATTQVHRTLTFADPPIDRITVREMILARVYPETPSYVVDLFLIHRTTGGDKKINATRNKVILEGTH